MNFYLLSLIKTAIVVGILMHVLAYLQWIERKVIAHVQLRVGPRRVGPHGLLQPLADVIKLITKEDILPSHVNKVFYFLAPFIAVTVRPDRDRGDSVRTRSSPSAACAPRCS